MAQQVEIKTTKDGRTVTYRDGTVYLAGKSHSGGGIVPLTTRERKAVPAGYTSRTGAIVLTDAEADILLHAHSAYLADCERIANLPVHVERRRIDGLFAQAERIKGSNPGGYYTLLHRAESALTAWRVQYPDSAREEQRDSLYAQAAHERHLAAGALTYDADGWLSSKEQERRHDEHITQAQAIEAEAERL